MMVLPIIGRELLSRSRNRATFWMRSAVGLAGVMICLQSLAVPFATPGIMGRYVFNGVLSAAFLVSCCVCFLTADAISVERREGTLELLFLTRIKTLDVLLGKLGSIGITSMCALGAFLPVLMVPVLAGGVTGGEAFRKGLALLNTLLLALVAGMCASATQQDRFRAVRRALLILGLVLAVPFVAFVVTMGGPVHRFGMFSPLVQMLAAGDLAYGAEPWFYWVSFGAVHLVTWGLLILAAFNMRKAVAEHGAELPRRPVDFKEAGRALGLGNWQPDKEDASPVEWLVYRQYGLGAGLWGLALLTLAYGGWASLMYDPLARSAGWAISWPLAVAGGLIGGVIVTWVASRFFVNVRRTGDLELLLTTPLGAESIVREQWKVLRRVFVWPVLVMQAPMLPQLLAGFSPTLAGPAAGLGHNPLWKLLSLGNTYLGASALCWLGLWFGMRARSQAGAIVWAVGLGKGVTSLVSLVGLLFGAALAGSFGTGSPQTAMGVLWLTEFGVLLFYGGVILVARQRLADDLVGREGSFFDLRHAALHPYG